LNPDWRKGQVRELREFNKPYPPEQVGNPVLFRSRFAVVRVANADRPLEVFGRYEADRRGQEIIEAKLREAQAKRRADILSTNFNESYKEYLLQLHDNEDSIVRHPDAAFAFVHDLEVRDSDGKVIKVDDPYQSMDFDSWKKPIPADVIRAGDYPIYTLEPNEAFELPIPSILGKVTEPRLGLVAGTYTVRVAMHYAAPPSGRTRFIYSEPVRITVTEEQIAAAVSYGLK
jgi:hypothetical protein